VFFLVLLLFSLYGTIYGSFLDKVDYESMRSSNGGSYSSSARSGSSSHYSGNGGYSSGK